MRLKNNPNWSINVYLLNWAILFSFLLQTCLYSMLLKYLLNDRISFFFATTMKTNALQNNKTSPFSSVFQKDQCLFERIFTCQWNYFILFYVVCFYSIFFSLSFQLSMNFGNPYIVCRENMQVEHLNNVKLSLNICCHILAFEYWGEHKSACVSVFAHDFQKL